MAVVNSGYSKIPQVMHLARCLFFIQGIYWLTLIIHTLKEKKGYSNPFFWVKILATQITHSLSWNDSGIVVVEIPSTFYG